MNNNWQQFGVFFGSMMYILHFAFEEKNRKGTSCNRWPSINQSKSNSLKRTQFRYCTVLQNDPSFKCAHRLNINQNLLLLYFIYEKKEYSSGKDTHARKRRMFDVVRLPMKFSKIKTSGSLLRRKRAAVGPTNTSSSRASPNGSHE